MEAVAEAPRKTPEVARTGKSITIRKEDIPWLETPVHKVELVTMRHGSVEFLFGSAVEGKKLKKAAGRLNEYRSELCNQLLNSHLPQFAEGFHPRVSTLGNAITHQPIFYVGNNGGQRLYFMRFGRIENKPVIVKIAVCDKSDQGQVLSVLTDQSKKVIKKVSRL